MLKIIDGIRSLTVGITVSFLVMLGTQAVLNSTSALSKSPEQGFSVWVEGNTVKIKPNDPVKPMDSEGVVVKTCKNEYEPFQLIITGTSGQLKNVNVDLTDLMDGNGNKIEQENIKMFREWYMNCRRPSDELGEAGEWPDALIPFVNPYAPSETIGVPFDVASGRNQPIWIRVYVPKNTVSGIYNGNISVSADNETTQTIPLTLHVWDFTLPDETHLKAVYGVENGSYLNDYFGVEYNSIEHNQLRDRYYNLLADNRLSPGIIYYRVPVYSEVDGNVQLDFSGSDALYSHLLDEKHASAFGIPSPWDDVNEYYVFRDHPELTDFSDDKFTNKVKQYYSLLYDHFEEKGWIDKHYVYVIDETEWGVSDEPYNNGKEGYERAIKWSKLIHAANPKLKFVIMDFPIPLSPYWPDLRAYGDIWDPYMDDIDTYPKAIEECQAIGKEIWTATNKYADYIDYKATMHRSVAWFAYKYDIDGLDQWDTTYWWSETEDKIINPWQDGPLTYAGNGGGAMIYPGKDIGINGPVSTIRLELSRESIEDYEYLYLLEQLGGKEYAKAIAINILPSEILSSETSAETFYAAREAIAEEIVNLQEQRSGLGIIRGKVTDADGQPVIGAFVSTGISGDITGNDGKYSLSVPAGENRITVAIPIMKSCLYSSYHEEYLSSSRTVSVNAGQEMSNVDFSLVRIQEGSALISSFEEDVAYWVVEHSMSTEQSTEHVTDGTYSYKVVFDDERETDMYIEFSIEENSVFDALEFDVYNSEDEFTGLILYIGESWEYENLLYLPPKTSIRVRVPVTEIKAKVNLQDTVTLGFCVDNITYSDEGVGTPLGKKTLYFDNIKLIGGGLPCSMYSL